MDTRWQSDSWDPDEDEMRMVAFIRDGDPGQVLLRKIDQMQRLNANQCMTVPPAGTEFIGLQEVSRFRGMHEGLQIVMNWLLAEREPETETQENDDG